MSFNYVKPRKRHFSGAKKNVSVGLPSEMIEFYKALAEQSGLTFTDVITDILDQVGEQMRTQDKSKRAR
ncbi:hypothetical protein DOM22_01215 [Bdellovibrio sp. ZAP7]|uniref:hypothetical protein n=1 Tax=Bdellovibrio sp. ZAP7 TaxID=2231053 RepID=UPI0011570FFC|nr:hypothetical protein [Bdellovibrio sp. ZAP7]QDK43877.1 hypothetical protein DOM22_01215 [Bdellovibrio sp. ZAP7]